MLIAVALLVTLLASFPASTNSASTNPLLVDIESDLVHRYTLAKMVDVKVILLVTQLPADVSPIELKFFFEQAGDVERILFRRNVLGSIFVIYKDSSSVSKAIVDLSGMELKGVHLTLRTTSADLEPEITDLMKGADLLPLLNQLSSLPKDEFDRLMTHFTPAPSSSVQPIPQPKLPNFSGDGQKGDVTYPQWRFHLKCILQDGKFSTSAIRQAIRFSLRGTAGDVMMYLDESSTPDTILDKFDVVFGSNLTTEQRLMQLFNAKQTAEESIVTWSLRLKRFFSQVKETSSFSKEVEPMLPAIFFYGLHNKEVIQATRHLFTDKITFDDLLAAVKKAEFECQSSSSTKELKKVTHQQITTSSTPSSNLEAKVDKILDAVTSLERRVATLEMKNVTCPRCHRKGHDLGSCFANYDVSGKRLN